MVFKVLSNPNQSMILRFPLFLCCPLTRIFHPCLKSIPCGDESHSLRPSDFPEPFKTWKLLPSFLLAGRWNMHFQRGFCTGILPAHRSRKILARHFTYPRLPMELGFRMRLDENQGGRDTTFYPSSKSRWLREKDFGLEPTHIPDL